MFVRCFKCWGFNHFSEDCKKEIVCKVCAGNHDSGGCNLNKKCVNCEDKVRRLKLTDISTDHEATDKDCPTYLRIINEKRKRIDYTSE